jgi:general L-amino acid transport system substrate-binding protein
MIEFMRGRAAARTIFILFVAIVTGVLTAPSASAGPTLDGIRSAGRLRCGVSDELPGFAFKDASGRWQGLNPDFCRAVAAAALGDGEKVTFIPLTASARFPTLLSGKIDLLTHTTTMTFSREAGIGVEFAGIYFYDGQALMVPRKSSIKKMESLKGATICVEKGTNHQVNLENTFRGRRLTFKPLVLESLAGVIKAFVAGHCDACTADRSSLAAARQALPNGQELFDILPGTLSKEPLSPVVRRGDEEWLTLTRWVLFALIEAEERGVTRKNVLTLQKKTGNPDLYWFLNASGQFGKRLGLKPAWIVTVINQVGNYGEIYERNFGSASALKIERGQNRLWTRGGLLYAPPFQ